MGLISTTNSAFNTTSPKTISVAVQAGDVLVVEASTQDAAATISTPTNDGTALTWTLQQSITTSSYAAAYVWTATADSSRTIVITLTRSGSAYYYGGSAQVWRDVTVGASAKTTGSGTPSLPITTTAANSALSVLIGDWNAMSGATRAWLTTPGTPTENLYNSVASQATWYGATYADVGAISAKTVGMSLPTGQKYSIITLELTGAATPLAASDAGTISASESTSLAGVLTPSDSGNLSATEARTVIGTMARTDSGTLSATESTTRAGVVPASDAGTISAIESVTLTPIITPEMHAAALAKRTATVTAKAELVDLSGNPVQWLAADGSPLYPTLTEATVEMAGEVPEQWSLRSATLTDPRWVPKEATDPLDPRSPLAIKLSYGVEVSPGLWGWTSVGVYRPTRPRIAISNGTVSVSFSGRDLLSVAMQGGYGGQVVDLGGLTVDAALRRIFAVVAPLVQFRAAISTITLPAVYQVGRGKPFDDWTSLGEMAGWIVRADADGVIVAGPTPDPSSPALILAEGRDCIIDSVTREISEATYNRVVVLGTHPDLTAPVVGVAEDDDPGSPTYVGLGNVRELPIESDAVPTVEAADNMAAMHLGKYIRPSETVTVRIPAHPELRYRDLIPTSARRAGVAGDYRLSKWTLALPIRKPELMEVTMMSRQVAR